MLSPLVGRLFLISSFSFGGRGHACLLKRRTTEDTLRNREWCSEKQKTKGRPQTAFLHFWQYHSTFLCSNGVFEGMSDLHICTWYTGQSWATPMSVRKHSTLKVIECDLSQAGIHDFTVSERLVPNIMWNGTLAWETETTLSATKLHGKLIL